MQLKHNNPMEKRMDLASLFCMIGHHGPVVAVAVIAVVSVVTGFILYRTLNGKRRKAEAGPGAGDASSSQGASRDAVQTEKEPSPEHEPRSRVESTDVIKEVSNARDGAEIRSRHKLKNRRATPKESPRSSSPLKEVKPEKLKNALKVEDTSSVTQTDVEETIKSLQDDTCEERNLNMEDEGYKHNLAERTNDAEGKPIGSLEPVVVSESLEKVQRSQKEEVTVEDVSTEIPCKDEENLCALNSPICLQENYSVSLNGNYKLNQPTSDSIEPEGYFEEPAIHMDESLYTKNEDEISVLYIASLNKPHPVSEDSPNVALQKHNSNQHTTMTSPAIDCAASEQSPNSDATENNLVELSTNSAVLPSSKELKLEQDSSTCSKNVEDVKMASFNEPQETAVVFSPVPSCLSVEPETINHEYQALPLVGLQPEDKIKDEVTSELDKATIDALCGLACPHSEVDEAINDILVSKENVDILSSPDAVVGDVSSASVSMEMSRPDDNVLSSFQDQEGEQMQIEDLLEVPSDPAPVMAETVEPQPDEIQLFYENPCNLTWCSPDVGVESGISSMAVSPDLPDENPLISEVLLPVSVPLPYEDQAELQTTMAESCAVIKEPTDAIPESSNDSQPHIKNTEAKDDSCTVGEIESFNTTVGKLAKDATADFCLNVDLGKMGTNIVIEGKREVEGKEEDKTTEINIMEATMDNNEWITDGTDQVLPWMKPPSSQINPVSIENVQVSSSVDATCTYTDVPPVNECDEDKVPLSDEATEPGKRVLAVQPMPQNVSVTFQIHYLTHSTYQKVAITGNNFELGNWKDFVPLEKVKDGFWATVVSLPAESHVEWKFVIVERGEVCRWEECGNRLLDTGNRETLLVHKCWGFL